MFLIKIVFFIFFFLKCNCIFAQENFESIIGTIDNKPITTYDLDQRIRLLLKSLRLEDNIKNRDIIRKRAIELLIEEKIKSIEIEKDKIQTSDKEIVVFLSKTFGFPENEINEFKNFLENENIDYEIIEEQVKTEIGWKKLVNLKLASKIYINPEKIDSIINDYELNAGKVQYNFSEIVIFKKKKSIEELRTSINKIKQILNEETSFETIATKFSESPSSINGGNLGWIFEDQIDNKTLSILKSLKENEISKFYEFDDSFKNVRFNKSKVLGEDGLKKLDVINFSFLKESEKILEFYNNIKNCNQNIDLIANKDDINYTKIENLILNDLPEETKKIFEDIKINEKTTIIKNKSNKMMFFLICNIEGGKIKKINRTFVENSYFQKRLAILSKTFLKKLKKNTNINLNFK